MIKKTTSLFLIIICTFVLLKGMQHIIPQNIIINSCSQTDDSENINDNFTEKIPFQLDEGFCFESIHWLNEDKLLVVAEKYQMDNCDIKELKKIYVYNILNNTQKILYNGEFKGDSSINQIKTTGKGNIGLQVLDRLLIFNINSKKFLGEVNFPVGVLEADFSIDRKKLVFKTIDGIYVTERNNNQPKLIEKVGLGAEGNPYPSIPQWANDNKIMYITYPDASDKAIINIISHNGSKFVHEKQFALNLNEQVQGYWFPDNYRLLVISSNMEDLKDSLYILNTIDNSIVAIHEKSLIGVPDTFGDYILLNPWYPDNGCNLELFNLRTNQHLEITSKFRNIDSCKFSPLGKSIAFLGNKESNLPDKLYVTHIDLNNSKKEQVRKPSCDD